MLFQKRKIQNLQEELCELDDYFTNDMELEELKTYLKESQTLMDNCLTALKSLAKKESLVSEEQLKGEAEKLCDKYKLDSDILNQKYKEQIEQFKTCYERRIALTKELNLLLGKK